MSGDLITISFPTLIITGGIVGFITGIVFIVLSETKDEFRAFFFITGLLLCGASIMVPLLTLPEYYTDQDNRRILPDKWYGLYKEIGENDTMSDLDLCKDFCERIAPTQPKLSNAAVELILDRCRPRLPSALLFVPFVENPVDKPKTTINLDYEWRDK